MFITACLMLCFRETRWLLDKALSCLGGPLGVSFSVEKHYMLQV